MLGGCFFEVEGYVEEVFGDDVFVDLFLFLGDEREIFCFIEVVGWLSGVIVDCEGWVEDVYDGELFGVIL